MLVKCIGAVGVHKSHELSGLVSFVTTSEKRSYRDVLVVHVSDLLKHPSTDVVAQVLSGRVWPEVAKIDVAVANLSSSVRIHVTRSNGRKACARENRGTEA